MGKFKTNMVVGAITRSLQISVTMGLPVHVHTFMDGSKALVTFIGRRANGERIMLIIHRLVPSADVEETSRGQRLMWGQLIAPSGKNPFWGKYEEGHDYGYFVLLAPRGSVRFHKRDDLCVATQGTTDTLDVYLLAVKQGPVGAVAFNITGDDGRQESHRVSFIGGEFVTEKVDV